MARQTIASRRANAANSLPARQRSRLTNGAALLTEVDGRSLWARRFRDLVSIHTNDLGGVDAVSDGEKFLIRRCACLNVELELLEHTFAKAGHAPLHALETYQRASNSLRRMLLALGLQRRSKDITPSLTEYLAGLDAKRRANTVTIDAQEVDGDDD